MGFTEAYHRHIQQRVGGFQARRAAQAPGAPLMPGQAPIKSILASLRLQQLYDLAYAFDVKINTAGRKDEILPVLLAEEAKGTFEKAPKRPYYYRRAMWQPGDPPIEEEFHDIDPSEEEMKINEEAAEKVKRWNLLLQKAKSHGINTHGMSRQEVEAALEKVGAA